MPSENAAAAGSGSASPSKPKTLPSGKNLPSLKIPLQMLSPTRRRAHRREPSQTLAVAASIVLVLLVAMELTTTEDASQDVKQWTFWIVTLVFPSQQVTWLKVVCLVVGFVLTSSYFLSSQAQLASAEQLLIHSATVLVSPLKRTQRHDEQKRLEMQSDPNAATPTNKSTGAWLASRCHSLLRTDHFSPATNRTDCDEIPQLKIRDECKIPTVDSNAASKLPSSESSSFEAVNRKQPIAFESEYFQGHLLFMAKNSGTCTSTDKQQPHGGNWSHLFEGKKRMLWVQVQGRFKKPLPPRAVMYLATELPTPDGFQVAFLTRQLVTLLITLVKKFVPIAHIAFGEKTLLEQDHELPHAAFPLYQTVDEWVVTPTDPVASESIKPPTLGQEFLGESTDHKTQRALTSVGMEPPVQMDAVYSFQFHTMYSDLAQWKIVNVPGMPDMDLKRFCGTQPIRLAVYTIVAPSLHSSFLCTLPHTTKDKSYVLCYSMHHSGSSTTPTTPQPTNAELLSPGKDYATTSRPPSSPLRWRSVSCDQPGPVVRQQSRQVDEHKQQQQQQHSCEESSEKSQLPPLLSRPQPRIRASSSVRNMTSLERAEDLSNWSFTLPVWIERVDPAAGNRKVAYLLVVEEKLNDSSGDAQSPAAEATKKSGRRRRCVVRSALTVKNTLLLLDETHGRGAGEFKKLQVESREFLYETICRETDQVAQALQTIAATPSHESSELDKDKQAMLFNCLMSESQLSCIRSYHDIGVQLTPAKRDQMDIIFEKGIYRMLDPRFLRQEWFTLTTTELHFFRSFTLKPSKTIQLTHVLAIVAIDEVPFFEQPMASETKGEIPHHPGTQDPHPRTTNQWFCVEIHVLFEVLTLFFDNASDRALCISSLNQLMKLKAAGCTAGASKSQQPALPRLPAPRSVDTLTAPLCCNQRKQIPLPQCGVRSPQDPLELVEELVELGLKVYARPREQIKGDDVVAFFTAVEQLHTLHLLEGDGAASPKSCFLIDDQRLAFALNLFHALYIHAWVLFGECVTHTQWKRLKSMVFYSLGSRSDSTNQGNPAQRHRPFQVTLADIEYGIFRAQPSPGDEYKAAVHSSSKSGFLPTVLQLNNRDFRTSFALQTNCNPASGSLIRVYHATTLHRELDASCALFLERELRIDASARIVDLPKICEWNAIDFAPPVAVSPLVGTRAFCCLQKLLPLMAANQHDRVQHLLLGAGKECQIKYVSRFWTQELSAPSCAKAKRHATPVPTTTTTEKMDSEAAAGTNTRIHSSCTTTVSCSSDDLTLVASPRVPAGDGDTSNGIPRSKSALQFLQSFF